MPTRNMGEATQPCGACEANPAPFATHAATALVLSLRRIGGGWVPAVLELFGADANLNWARGLRVRRSFVVNPEVTLTCCAIFLTLYFSDRHGQVCCVYRN
jgi:hypothetical protein